uniref:Gingipain domain-containing protein n=1 Tax=candidate division WOR-3 bacterium TaxID=2052148 RepID=A0A7C4U7T1_UNCW3
MWLVLLFGFVYELKEADLVSGAYYWEKGMPSIPFVKREFVFDEGIFVDSVSFKVMEAESVFGADFGISYGGIELGKYDEVSRNDSVFNSSSVFPDKIGEIVSEGYSSRNLIVNMNIYPYRFIPAKKILIKLKKIDIEFYHHRRERKIFYPVSCFSNQNEGIDFVIITDTAFKNTLLRLSERRNLMGIKTEVFTTDWIYKNYSGFDNPSKIRNFIIDAYHNLKTRFVLLAGDIDIVPIRYLYATCYYLGFYPTDLYYADIDGSYDANRNGIFGEVSDSIDGFPDLFVGRLPFSKKEDFENYIDRLISYEENWNFEKNLLLLGASVTSGGEGWGAEMCENIHNMIPFVESYRLYYPLSNSSWSGDKILNRYNTITEMNKGYNLINHIDHADITYIGTGILSGGMKIYNTDMKNLSGKNGIMITISCSPNAIDFESFGKGFIRFNGVGFIGNVRTGWTYQFYQEMDFFKAIFIDSLQTLGEAWSKILTGNLYFRSSMLLLGDPTLKIYWKKPIRPSVKFNNIIDQNSFAIFVTDSQGAPIKDVNISLIGENGLILKSKTDETGKVIFNKENLNVSHLTLSAVSNFTFPVFKEIDLSNENEIQILRVNCLYNKLFFTFLNSSQKKIKINGFILNQSSGESDTLLKDMVINPLDSLTICFPILNDKNLISGKITIKTESKDFKFDFLTENIKKRIALTGLEYTRIGDMVRIKNIHITNLSDEKMSNIIYGFPSTGIRKINEIPPLSDYVDSNSYVLSSINVKIFINNDTFSINEDFPIDSIISFSFTPMKRGAKITFNMKNDNLYNIYVDGVKKNLEPLTKGMFEIKDISPNTLHILKIVPVSSSFIENKNLQDLYIYSNPDEKANWPVFTGYPDYFSNFEVIDKTSPSIGDIDGDGENEIVITTTTGYLYVIKRNGHILEGFPVSSGSPLFTPPVVFDLDMDGRDEIIIGLKSNKSFAVINSHGEIVFECEKGNGMLTLNPVVFNENNNTYILFGGVDGSLYLLDNNFNILPNWPLNLSGVNNITIGRFDESPEISIAVSTYQNKVYFISISGEIKNTFQFDGTIMGMITADIDKDGKDEVILTLSNGKVYAIKLNGILQNFPFVQCASILTPPVVGDIDNDNNLEIIFVNVYGNVYSVKSNGSGTIIKTIPKINGIRYVSPLIGDLDGDGDNDIMIKSTDGYIYSFDKNGKSTIGFPIRIGVNDGETPLICDIDKDGRLEIFVRDGEGYLHCYNLKGSSVIWGTFGLNKGRDNWFRENQTLYSLKNKNEKEGMNFVNSEKTIVFDILGRKILEDKNGEINFKNLPSGIYFVQRGKKVIKNLRIR